MAKDYYGILGVDKNASSEEIKKAYRNSALKYHPDRGGDAEKFKEVNEAYQVLSNPEKKAQYDQFGTTSDNFGQGGGGYQSYSGSGNFNYDDMFSSGYGGGFDFSGIFENFFGSAFAHVNVELTISLTQAILGDKVSFRTNQGDNIEFKIPAGTTEGQQFRVRGKGMAYKRGRGDLIVTIKISMPRKLSREQRELFEKLRDLGI